MEDEETMDLTAVGHLGAAKWLFWYNVACVLYPALFNSACNIYSNKLKIAAKYDVCGTPLWSFYFIFILWCAIRKLAQPVKLRRRVKSWWPTCDNLWFSLFQGTCVPLHFMAMFNLFGGFENFGIRDCSLLLLTDLAVSLSCRYPKGAPLLPVLISLALQLVKPPSTCPPHTDTNTNTTIPALTVLKSKIKTESYGYLMDLVAL
ncbi:RING/U-box superfamily protein [Striga asiatica]|uniref:RING/U-box superfamily protein n=1 Tax=Striga asiatica TaxID=4170 RepID=A0A5A7QGA8_STRAF|nr:RING/U-box superfamily protein [Striga asiatica]